MKIKAEVLLDVPEDLIADLRDNWGCGLDTFLHDELEMAVNHKIRIDTKGKDTYVGGVHPYRIVGMKVGGLTTGELHTREEISDEEVRSKNEEKDGRGN